MNRQTSLILGLALAAAAGVASAESYQEYNTPFVSTTSRAAVQSQVQAAAHAPNPWSTSYNPLAQFRSEKTRAQVSAEFIGARDTVSAFTGEDSGSGYLSRRPAAAGNTRLAGQPVTAR
jgi:hypothetical protein